MYDVIFICVFMGLFYKIYFNWKWYNFMNLNFCEYELKKFKDG